MILRFFKLYQLGVFDYTALQKEGKSTADLPNLLVPLQTLFSSEAGDLHTSNPTPCQRESDRRRTNDAFRLHCFNAVTGCTLLHQANISNLSPMAVPPCVEPLGRNTGAPTAPRGNSDNRRQGHNAPAARSNTWPPAASVSQGPSFGVLRAWILPPGHSPACDSTTGGRRGPRGSVGLLAA